VVLSACRTAAGEGVRGEWLGHLTRAFFHAGSRRVVVTLWDIDDISTAELMTVFYRGMLKEGRSPAAALRQAKIEISKRYRWQAPWHWAGFVLQGEPR